MGKFIPWFRLNARVFGSGWLLLHALAGAAKEAGTTFSFEQYLQTQPNSVQLSLGSDSEEGRNSSVDADLRLPNDYRFLVGGGSHRSDLDGEELKTQSFRLGLASDPANEYQGTLVFEDWGVKEELSYRKWSAALARWGETWNTQGTAAYRQIHLITDHPSIQGFDVEVHSPAMALSVQGAFGSHWSVRLSGEKNWYNVDVSVLQNSRISQFFSPETLTLSSSFVDRVGSLEVGYQFSRWYLGVEGTTSVSAIDDTRSRTGTLLVSWEVNRSFALQVQAGRSTFPDSTTAQAVTFGQLGLSFAWNQ